MGASFFFQAEDGIRDAEARCMPILRSTAKPATRNDLYMSMYLIATLHQPIAARILERISANVQKYVCVTDASGEMIASSNGMSPGDVHEIAGQAIADGAIVRKPNASASIVGMPLTYGGQIVGAIVLDDVTSQNNDIVYM